MESFCLDMSTLCVHFSAPKFYGELRERTLPRFKRIAIMSYFLTGIILFAFPMVGYMLYGSKVSQNLVVSFTESKVTEGVALLSVFGSYFLFFFCVKKFKRIGIAIVCVAKHFFLSVCK